MDGPNSGHRLLAIVSGDVVGYSRLIASDESAAIGLLRERRLDVERHVERHEGRLFDFTGDNFLAGFPTAQKAVLFATGLQSEIAERDAALASDRRMEFRLGVHQGEVRLEEGRVFGTGVNIAARLESLADPGGIAISGSVREQIQGRLPLECEDLGDKSVKNIPNPVRVYRVLMGRSARKSTRMRDRLGWKPLAAGAAVAIVVGVIAASWSPPDLAPGSASDTPTRARNAPGERSLEGDLSLPDRPSIAVLPFANLSDDLEQEYLADGITEDLTTDLARIPQLFVIARNSAFTYKNKAVDASQIGRDLGVRYLLEGSVRRIEDRVRVNAQLIDATSGFHLWAERYDGALSEILDLQAEIGRKILTSLEVEIGEAERSLVEGAEIGDASAYEGWLRGRVLSRRVTRENVSEGRRWLERAIELEPGYAEAHAELSQSYLAEYAEWNHEPDLLEQAGASARRALELDAQNSESQLAMGMVRMAQGLPDEALPFLERAVALSINSFVARSALGLAQMRVGMLDEGIANLEDAVRLNPRIVDITWTALGYARYLQGRLDEAVELWERARASSPDIIPDRISLIGHYQAVGQEHRAEELAAEILAAHPGYTAADATRLYVQLGFVREDTADLFRASLEYAGLP